MDFHEVASIFPLMTDAEYADLTADIAEHGLREPVWTWQGKIVDGRNRYRACVDLGIEPQYREWDGNGSLVAFVVSLNLKRRHLTKSQEAAVAVSIKEQLQKENPQGTRNDLTGGNISTSSEKNRDVAGETLGVSGRYVDEAEKIKDTDPTLFGMVRDGALTLPEAKQMAALPESVREAALLHLQSTEEHPPEQAAFATAETPQTHQPIRAKKARANGKAKVKEAIKKAKAEDLAQKYESTTTESTDYRFVVGDFRRVAEQLEPESIDAIITDPPYSDEYLPLYEMLAQEALRLLKPGAPLLVMTGQSYLPQVLSRLTAYMSYHWTLAYLTPGGQSPQIWPRKVNTFWKPVIWLVKGEHSGEWHGDVVRSDVNDNDKRFHEWGQSESGIGRLVEAFTQPGDLILDPFAGAGTTGVVAALSKRRFIGVDIDGEVVRLARARVAEALHANMDA